MTHPRDPDRPTGLPGAVPPGWYPDPSGGPTERWWDGGRWGVQTRPSVGGAPGLVVPVAVPAGVTNRAATAALVLGILALFLNTLMVTSLLGVVFAVIGLTRAAGHEQAGFGPVGRARAIWGLVLCVVGGSTTLLFKGLLF